MRIKLMRKIDYYLGIPICYFISIINKLIVFPSKKNNLKNCRKVLFIKFLGMGSIVLASSALKLFKAQYPSCKIYFMTFNKNKDICELLNLTSNQYLLTVDESSLISIIIGTLKNIIILRRQKIDAVIDMEFFSRATAIISFLISPAYRVGFCNPNTKGLYRGNFLTHPVRYNCYKHTIDIFGALLKPFDVQRKNKEIFLPKIKIDEKTKEEVFCKLKKINCNVDRKSRLIIINVNSSKLATLRKWPKENFIILADKIIDYNHENFLIFIGDKADKQYVTSCISGIKNKNNVVNLSSKINIRELTALFYSSKVFITNDSGPAHLAGLTDINIFVFFGPETPVLYRPISDRVAVFYKNFYCSPCLTIYNGKYSTCKNNECLRGIGVNEVFYKIKDYI